MVVAISPHPYGGIFSSLAYILAAQSISIVRTANYENWVQQVFLAWGAHVNT